MLAFLTLVLSAAIVYSRLIIDKDAAYDITDWSSYWFEDDLWDIDRRISYDNTHITQKCMEYEGNNDFSKLCLCKYPHNSNLYYCHHGSVKSKQHHHHQSYHHISAKNAYKNLIRMDIVNLFDDDEFDPDGYSQFAMSFNLNKGKDDSMVAEMGKYDKLDAKKNLVDQIKNEFAIMWCFAKKYKGAQWENARDTFEDAKQQAIIAAETALSQYKNAKQKLDKEKEEYIKQKNIKETGNALEMKLERDVAFKWKEKKEAVIALIKEHTKKVKERIEKIMAARKTYTQTVTPLLKDGIDAINTRLTSDTVTKAYNSKTNQDTWKLSKIEIAFLVAYVMEDAIASATRAYWREDTNDRYPTLRDLVYGVTHLPASTTFLTSIATTKIQNNDHLVLWFGMRNVDYPVTVALNTEKSIGQALGNGVTLRGLWSTTMQKAVAERYAGCPPNDIRSDGVVFKIKVPKANVNEINAIDVRWLSTEKGEDHGEILLYDIPGKYVYVWKRCYFDQMNWAERKDNSNHDLVPIEANGD